jgi:lysophosphatidylcholine acyltransferase/lyso-PAF acetyltransferase
MCRYGVSHVAKAETKSYPLIGALSTAVQQVYVRRSSATQPIPGTHSASEVREVIEARCQNMGANGYRTLCLYPEATTTNGQSIIHFKLGAFHPGAPVQPCIIRHSHCHFDPS